MSIWSKYLKGKKYIDDKGLVDKHNWYWDMYLGDQWKGVKSMSELPVMNFIKPVVDYKAAAIGQNQMTAIYSDDNTEHEEVYKRLNTFYRRCWDKEDMDIKLFHMIEHAGILGDSVLYFGKKDEARIVPPSNVIYADEQSSDVQTQKYIIIRIRPFVKDVKKTAQKNGIDESLIQSITSDTEPDYIVGERKDIDYDADEGKCTAVIYFEKIDGIVHIARATAECEYEPLHPIAMTDESGTPLVGCEYYPIVKLICQEKPNSARGRGWVQDLIPNQIEVNKTYARVSQANANTAYPRVAYNASMIQNPEDLNNIGAPIEIDGTAQSVSQIISYLQGTPMSSSVFTYADTMLTTTKQLAGANDSISNISDPSRVSGTALQEIREQTTINLKGNLINVKNLYRDIARIKMDMWQVYYPGGVDVRREPTPEEQELINSGQPVDLIEHIDGELLRSLEPDVTIDVTLRTESTKADQQTVVDAQLDKGRITFSEWVDVVDEDGVVPKQRFEQLIQKRKDEGRDVDTGLPLQTVMPEQQINPQQEVPEQGAA